MVAKVPEMWWCRVDYLIDKRPHQPDAGGQQTQNAAQKTMIAARLRRRIAIEVNQA